MVKFNKIDLSEEDRDKIKRFTLRYYDDDESIVQKIPAEMAHLTIGIKIFAQHYRLSKWIFENTERITEAKLIAEFKDHTEEDFIKFYREWVKDEHSMEGDNKATEVGNENKS